MGRKLKSRPPHAPQPATNGDVRWLTVVGARQNNLKNVDISIPLGRFVCVTGVSGSGKSSLVNDIIAEQLARDLNKAEKYQPGRHERLDGEEHLDKVLSIDQSPIGRTPRSNPATYIKAFDLIRDLYARLPDAKVRGYKPGRFSFNVSAAMNMGGRCESCEGNGATRVDMDFLADLWVSCPVCQGRRFTRETLQILFKGKSVADVLEMDVGQAHEHFANVPKIAHMLETLHRVGLDYIKLGQSSVTLSGGEAQRIKLARELVRRSTGKTLYILDEPTTGLHFDDIKRLLSVLHGFVDAGNSVLVIEHNLDVIKTADWIIDLGPEGGADGGHIVAQGTPESVAQVKASHTGQALRHVLDPHRRRTQSPIRLPKKAHRRRAGSNGALNSINVVGARQHNLKNITVDVPRGKMTVFSGLSGSGKSSLAIDTIYAEGQRRYIESLSAYARQFLVQFQKPHVDHVHGLSPAIAIEQKSATKSPRSTVGTVTEIYDYMRIFWARIGQPFCHQCQAPIGSQSSDEIVERLLDVADGLDVILLAPLSKYTHESYADLIERQRSQGFRRLRVDGHLFGIEDDIPVDDLRQHRIEAVIDRIKISKARRGRITESVELALAVGGGNLLVWIGSVEERLDGGASTDSSPGRSTSSKARELRFSQLHSCSQCGVGFDEPTPHHFSFNTRLGWCPNCEGLGVQKGASPDAIAPRPSRSILGGALSGWESARRNRVMAATLTALAHHVGFDVETPWTDLDETHKMAILFGTGDDWITPNPSGNFSGGSWKGVRFRWRGYFPAIDRAVRASWTYRRKLDELATDVSCAACEGSRLRRESRFVRIAGMSIDQVCRMPLQQTAAYFKSLKLNARQRRISGELLHEIESRIQFLVEVGLHYLTLHRPAPSLSGGESQRIRLASQIGSGLTGVLYVLDEPTIGLHPRDNDKLIGALRKLRNLGNTLIVVEHDRDVMADADHVIDFGPGAGADGGYVVGATTPARLHKSRQSLTGQYLAGKQAIEIPTNRRPVDPYPSVVPNHWLVINGARHHNLREIDVAIPLGRFIAVTGVSGSGKSSLVTETVYPALANRIHRTRTLPGAHDGLFGAENIDKIILVDASPIGNSPSSNAATYTGLFDHVRELFARLPESKIRGYTANRFSFNRPGGRCEACEGFGQRRIEMHFLADVWVECESCGGARYIKETLDVRYREKNIADVLQMRVAEALRLFDPVPKVRRLLQTLDDVGLGYLQLGQPAPTLSGGEAQRVRLAAELGRPSTGKTFYVLDEPTTGLHFHDLRKLLDVLHRLVDLGNTVLCIEHNLDVIKTADHVIDIGPDAANLGGTIVVAGTPETVASHPSSHTGLSLQSILAKGPYAARTTYDAQRQTTLEQDLAKPIDVGAMGIDGQMPWIVNGKAWHTVNHRDRQGRPVCWDPGILTWLVETIESVPGMNHADWNQRACVEIKAKNGGKIWFAHLLTGGRELLELSLRVPTGRFQESTVARQLAVKSLDQRDDLPIYGAWSRVRVRSVSREYDEVRAYLRDFKDVKKTAFKSLVQKACQAHLSVLPDKDQPTAKRPWISNGRQWHMSQQNIHPRRRITWSPALIPSLIGKLSKLSADLDFDWSGKVSIGMRHRNRGRRVGKIVTNMGDGLRCEFIVPKGRFTPMQIERLGSSPTLKTQSGRDTITFWVASIDQLDVKQLLPVVQAACKFTMERQST